MIESILAALAALFGAITKLTPPDQIRIGNFDLRKEKLEGQQRINILNKEYTRLKGHPEINIADEINFVYANIDDADRALLIKDVTDFTTAYRLRHKIIFRKWLLSQGLIK